MLHNFSLPYCRNLILALVLALAIPADALADTLFKPEGNCSRTYIYRSRTYPVDSSRKLDGEGLRKILDTNPTSKTYLNEYQSNLKTSRIPAYIGTAGLAVLIGGPIYAAGIQNPIGAKDTRTVSLIGGASLLIGSYFIGKYLIHENENKLESAVQAYNASASKSDQIAITLAPSASPDGGEIKTIVPFQF